jgi:RNA polymerase sigma factor (sigma-70 family)
MLYIRGTKNSCMELIELIEGCKKQDRRSYTKLYEAYRPKMLAISRKFFKDDDTIEEVIQQSFIKIFEKIDSYNDMGLFDGWVAMIVRSKAIDILRKPNLSTHEFNDSLMVSDPQKEVQEYIDSEINIDLIKSSIEELPKAYKSAFNLYVVQNYSHIEVSNILGISAGSSKSNLFKAKNKIRKLIKNKVQFN